MNRNVRGSGRSGLESKSKPVLNGSAAPEVEPAIGADVIDAGLKSLDHYKRALPRWRYSMRQMMLPLIRWETPYLAWLQGKMRTPALDSYFAVTANLGTHTFFMVGLPLMFWCGFREFGKGLVHILASGVFFTGFLKDMLSLPRPLSPPLHRISMSGSAALEYGFPSTHSANAVSVAVLGVLMLRDPSNTSFSPAAKLALELLSYFYAVSIVLGRLYCGMHGFLDVIVGSLFGITISLVQFHLGAAFDEALHASGWRVPLAATLTIIVLVRIHPEPVDDCPCFDDSVAFAGVMIGLELGSWHYARGAFAWPAGDSFSLHELGPLAVLLRLCLGVVVIFAWREAMKPALLKTLPYLFRAIERCGLSLPRRFFVKASEYRNIPDLLRLHTDNVIPSISDLPGMLRSIRRVGRRGRSVSIGPQSAADAYETLAYRERRRRESMGSNASVRSRSSLRELREEVDEEEGEEGEGEGRGTDGAVLWRRRGGEGAKDAAECTHASGLHHHPGQPVHPSTLAEYESQMGSGTVFVSPVVSPTLGSDDDVEPEIYIGAQDELGEREMFEKLMKPRVRYDVEVVTKLVVYAGIAWLSIEFIPILFEFLPGLGIEHLRPRR